MRLAIFKRIRWLLIPALLAVFAAAPGLSVKAATPPTSGIMCTTSSSPNASFTLTASADYINMPDGNTIWTWSYSPGGGAFQFPGPVLCVNQGDTVTVVLNNGLPEATSIMFLGVDNVQANGAPAQPEFNGTTLTSLTKSAPANGSVTYSFTASNPGTYLYESGTDVGKQVQMGLYGALVVRPANHPNWAYSNGAQAFGQFDLSTEFVMLLSEMDPNLHSAVELGQPYDVTTLHPRYWLINGRAFPDTIAPNNAAWLPNQPYSALMHVKVQDNSLLPNDPNGPNKAPALIRYLNAGSRNHPFHPHGQNGRLLARDATPLFDGSGNDLSYETFAFTIGSGQTWDQTYHYDNQEHFAAGSNPIPVTMPQLQNLTFKDAATYYSGSPYLGDKGQLPVATTSFNECGEYYMVMHSHALYEVANYDAGFGGMLTLERIDPLTPAPGTTCTP
jgi:hypothetical protein